MSVISGKNYTSFTNVRLKGQAGASSADVRLADSAGTDTVLVAPTNEGEKTLTLPNKSGKMCIQGTVVVHLPAIAATTFIYSTVVTVAGIRTEDALTCSMQVATIYTSARILSAAVPGNGSITLTFANIGAVGLGEYGLVLGYVASR